MKRLWPVVLGIVLSAGSTPSDAEAATRRVPEDYATIQAAIDAAQFGDTIQVAPGTYQENLIISKRGISVKGAGYSQTILKPAAGNTTHAVMRIQGVDATVTVSGFTIRDGISSLVLVGGGIDIEGASPIIQDNLITANSSMTLGGGIAIRGSSSAPLILRNLIRNNQASGRGRSGDWGGYGGGIYIGSGAKGTIAENEITGNDAWATGSGIYCGQVSGGNNLIPTGGSPVIYKNLIARNSSDYGGAIKVAGSDSSPLILNNLVVDNVGQYQEGSGVDVDAGKIRVINNTIAGTLGARQPGYGIYVRGSFSTSDSLEVRNNLIAFNEHIGIEAPAHAVLAYNDVFGHPTANYSGAGTPGPGSLSADPLFVDRAAGDHRLKSGSPAINAGDPDAQYNDPDGSRNDMGAFGGPGFNRAPIADSQEIFVTVNTPKAVTLTAADPDGDSLSYNVVSAPSHGSLSGSPPALTYTPNTGYAGPESFTFKANDGRLDSNTATVSVTVGTLQLPSLYQEKLRRYAKATVRYFTSARSNNKLAGLPHAFFGEAAKGAWRECDKNTGSCIFRPWALTRGYGSHVNMNEVTLRFLVLGAAYKMDWLDYLPNSSRYAQSWGQIKTGLKTIRSLQTSADAKKYYRSTFHRAYATVINRSGQIDVDRTAAEITRTGPFEQSSDDNGLACMNLLILEGLAADLPVSTTDRAEIVGLCRTIRAGINLRRFVVNDAIVHNFTTTSNTPSTDRWDRSGAEGALILAAMLVSGKITLEEFHRIAPSLQNKQVSWSALQGEAIPIEQATYHSAVFIHGLRSLHGMPVTPNEFPSATYFLESAKPAFMAHMDLALYHKLKALGSQAMTQVLRGYPVFEYWSGSSEFSGQRKQVQFAGNEEDRRPDPARITGDGAMARGTAPHAWFVPLSRWRELDGSQLDALFGWMGDYEGQFFHSGSDTLLGWEAVIPWFPGDTEHAWLGGGRMNYTDWGRPYEALNAAYTALHIFDALNPDKPLASYSAEARRLGPIAAYFDSGAALPPELFPSPDLVMTALSGPTAAAVGNTISLVNTVKNQGSGNAAGFYVGLYLSTDATITTGDRRLGSRYVSSLAAGASSRATTSVILPATLSPRKYYFGAIADYSNRAVETSETNNARTGNTVSIR